METIQKKKCIFKKRRGLKRIVSLKIMTAFTAGVLFGFVAAEGQTYVSSYFNDIEIQLAYNAE